MGSGHWLEGPSYSRFMRLAGLALPSYGSVLVLVFVEYGTSMPRLPLPFHHSIQYLPYPSLLTFPIYFLSKLVSLWSYAVWISYVFYEQSFLITLSILLLDLCPIYLVISGFVK